MSSRKVRLNNAYQEIEKLEHELEEFKNLYRATENERESKMLKLEEQYNQHLDKIQAMIDDRASQIANIEYIIEEG